MNPATPLLPPRLTSEAADESLMLPVIEEHVTIQRAVVETGRVVVTKRVHEADEQVIVPVQHDEVHYERVPFNQTLPAGAVAPGSRQEGDTLIIPVLREVAVVEKRLLLVEELRITKRQITTEHAEALHLRREEVLVERLPPREPTPGS